jgi:hypothetical protein
MFFTHSTFIGIDPTAGTRPFYYAAINNELELLALGQGSMNDVLAFVAGQREAFVAVSAPSCPNQGLMTHPETRTNLSPPPRPGRWTNFRIAEYQLRQHNINIPQTRANERMCPGWMQMGFILYKRLKELGYVPYPSKNSTHQWIEVYPHACYSTMLERIPFSKHTLEGRIQRQLVLYENRLKIPDPMRVFQEITRHRLLQGVLTLENLYLPEELDALVSAYTAQKAANHPDQVMLVGDPAEGQLVLPVATLKLHYST